MVNSELIYRGIVIRSKCKYFYIHKGKQRQSISDDKKDLLEITYTDENVSAKDLANTLGYNYVGADKELIEMPRPAKFTTTTIKLNGLEFKKLTYDPHTIRIVIVGDEESKVSQDYYHTTVVVSKNDYKNQDFIKYLFGKTEGWKYIVPTASSKSCLNDYKIRNFPSIVVQDKSISLQSDSEIVYFLRNKYDKYLIRSVDYQDQFIKEVKYRLEQYGIELVRYNREKTLTSTSYATYRFNQTPSNYSRPQPPDEDQNILYHRIPVEFEFRCTNMQMFFDFKNRYNNVTLLTNMCEYKTSDRYGSRWSAAVKWGRITEDFSHTYESDSNSNFSYQCQFNCELYFYEAFDDVYKLIEKIAYEMEVSE